MSDLVFAVFINSGTCATCNRNYCKGSPIHHDGCRLTTWPFYEHDTTVREFRRDIIRNIAYYYSADGNMHLAQHLKILSPMEILAIEIGNE